MRNARHEAAGGLRQVNECGQSTPSPDPLKLESIGPDNPGESTPASPGAELESIHHTDRRIGEVATRQGGVVALRQLRELGLTRGEVDSRLRIGRLTLLHRGVYAVGHTALTPRAHAIAALAATSNGAVLSFETAGWLYECRPIAAQPVHLSVEHGRRVRLAGVIVHQTRWLPDEHVTKVRGMRTTTLERTLVDLASTLDQWDLHRAVSEAEFQEIIDLPTLHEIISCAPGHKGIPLLRAIIGDDGPLPTRSQLEDRTFALIDAAGLPRPESNVQLGKWNVDFYWRAHNVALEVHGWKAHRGRLAFERDHRKQNELELQGTRVIAATWRLVKQAPILVASRCATTLAKTG